MKFKGEPNLYVRITNKYIQRATGKKGFYFDNNGFYETDNEILCKVLRQNFEEPKFRCKKCDFETDNKVDLMKHYKDKHPKGE